jgi:amidase
MAAPDPAPAVTPDTAASIAAAVRAGDLTARAATEAALARIAERDGAIGAFQVVRGESALREADAVDQRADRFSLPLAGVPIAIKDNVAVSGEPMRIGSAASSAAPSEFDHEIVRRLRRAGAVVVGLTTVPELCVFGATDSSFGITRNPWDLDRTPGGSSGGAAAAVAAGMIVAAHGNDGMGSIRIPAACCGLVGIKPGLGVVPADLGNGSWFDMSENGPLATTVADCALILSVLAARPELAEIEQPGALRIAVSTRNPIQGLPVDKSWADAAGRAAAVLREAGHTVRQANPPYGQRLAPSALARWMAGTELDARTLADRSRVARRTSAHAAAGRLVLRAGFPKDKGRDQWRRRAEAFFANYDVLVTPALARSPIRAVAWSERGWLANLVSNVRYAPFASPWNVAGWPAMAVPTGIGADGLPRAVQLVARPGGEATLLGLAAQIEQRRPWQRTAR